jgi:ADP-ribosylglycohydrolase
MNTRADRVRNCLLGAALGEALSWSSLFARSYQLPPWPRRILREMAEWHEREGIVRLPLPFSLNQPAEAFDLCPVAGTEWIMMTALTILEAGGEYDRDKALRHWLDLAAEGDGVRASVGVMTSLDNLRKGLLPPFCGHDNPHYLDDSGLLRAIPIGACYAGRAEDAEAAARFDASITNAEDGVIGAVAVARGIALACAGASLEDVVREVVESAPADSMVGSGLQNAIAAFPGGRDPLSAIPALHGLVNREYSYGGVAAETLAVAIGVLRLSGGDLPTALLAAAAVPKSAESVPLLVGAFAASLCAREYPIPAEWLPSLSRLRGVAIPALRGLDLVRSSEEFASATGTGAMR